MRPGEEPALWQLFYDTVHTVNLGDYTPAQVNAWAPHTPDMAIWNGWLNEPGTQVFLATKGSVTVGYGTLRADGCIGHLFSHWSWQGRGVGRALLDHIHAQAQHGRFDCLFADVSVTARRFFQAAGFAVQARRLIQREDERLESYLMRKELTHS